MLEGLWYSNNGKLRHFVTKCLKEKIMTQFLFSQEHAQHHAMKHGRFGGGVHSAFTKSSLALHSLVQM